jgi:hypothetical protein
MIIHDNKPLFIFYRKIDAVIKKSEIEEFDVNINFLNRDN